MPARRKSPRRSKSRSKSPCRSRMSPSRIRSKKRSGGSSRQYRASTAKTRWITAKDTINEQLRKELRILRDKFEHDTWVDEFLHLEKAQFCDDHGLNPNDFQYLLFDANPSIWDKFVSYFLQALRQSAPDVLKPNISLGAAKVRPSCKEIQRTHMKELWNSDKFRSYEGRDVAYILSPLLAIATLSKVPVGVGVVAFIASLPVAMQALLATCAIATLSLVLIDVVLPLANWIQENGERILIEAFSRQHV